MIIDPLTCLYLYNVICKHFMKNAICVYYACVTYAHIEISSSLLTFHITTYINGIHGIHCPNFNVHLTWSVIFHSKTLKG